jgi:hypothetical protein
MEVLCFILACYGLTQILIYGTIFDIIRPKQGKIAIGLCLMFNLIC